MRKFLTGVLFLLASSLSYAQLTSVTATITDSDSTVWAGAQYQVTFVPNPNFPNLSSYSIAGVPIQSTTYNQYINQSGTSNGSGVLSVTLLDNSQVLPGGSTWKFVIQPLASSQAVSYAPTTVSGSSQSLTTYLSSNSIAPRFSALPNSYGYIDGEINPTPRVGGFYYNVTNNVQRIWNGTAWINGGGSSGSGVSSFNTRTGAVVPATGDYTVAQVTGAAPLASPTFTGTPTAPTATGGTNNTQLATTAFVQSALPSVPVTSVFARTGAVVAASADYTCAQVTNCVDLTSTQTLTGKTVDGVTPTTFGFVDPTSSIQTQLNTLSGGIPPLGTAAQVPIMNAGATAYVPQSFSQDCTISTAGVLTCLKTNNVAFTSAATTAIGTSGATIPLLSTANTWTLGQTFSALAQFSLGENLATGQVLSWNSDTGFSRSAAKTIFVGNGTQGDITGLLNATSYQASTAAVLNTSGFAIGSTVPFAFSSTSAFSGSKDTGISRGGVGIVAIGTGAAGNVAGGLQAGTYLTGTNCSSSASPAVCGSAAAGSVNLPTNAVSSSIVVNTTAVTANSQIFVTTDDTLGTKLGVTCNSTVATLVGGLTISARTAGTSFTIANNVAIVTNPLCVSYFIIN